MQRGNLSPGRWKWFRSNIDDDYIFSAYSNKIRNLTIIFNKDGFINQFAFCDKLDFKQFASFIKIFLDSPHVADVEYITSEKFYETGQPLYKIKSVYYQPNTSRKIFEKEIVLETDYWNDEDIQNLIMDTRQKIYSDIIKTFNDNEKKDLVSLLDVITLEFDKSAGWD